VRNALVHADAFRVIHGMASPMAGHACRYAYRIGTIGPPLGGSERVVSARGRAALLCACGGACHRVHTGAGEHSNVTEKRLGLLPRGREGRGEARGQGVEVSDAS
jgi:hypothetical protein